MNLLVELIGLMNLHRLKPDKKLGQNFLINENALQKIIQLAELKSDDKVLEIGSGTGFLSREIANKSKIICIEYDKTMCNLLEKNLPKEKAAIINAHFPGIPKTDFNKIVSLPPYNISTTIMSWLMEQEFELAVLVFQREFVERMLAFPGYPDYNALSVLSQFYFDIKKEFILKQEEFFPKPKVESIAIKIRKKKTRLGKEKQHAFNEFIKQLFRFKNKSLKNALRQLKKTNSNLLKKDIEEIRKKKYCNKKTSMLEIEEFVDLFNSIAF